jgi:predicted NAD/FAD-binding protein
MKKLAIIGTGIAGMSAAYFLKENYDITVFEKNDYIGGHTNTIDVHDGEKDCSMDTGFMVFNETTYPNLVKLFKKLNVPYVNTDMSFSVRNAALDLEFNGSSLNGIFSQRRNLFNWKFLKMIREILKFNSHADVVITDPKYAEMSIGDYIMEQGHSEYFFDNFLAPMSSAVWSTPTEKMLEFPAKSLVQFFKNHGFVGVNTQLQWKTVDGGSRVYRDLLIESFEDRVNINSGVKSITQNPNNFTITTSDTELTFDKVIIASHADEALKLIANPTEMQKEVLGAFKYQKNIATVHTDNTLMPNLKRNWSSWNFLMRSEKQYTVYYMNKLQGVSDQQDFFVNINGEEFVDKNKVIKSIEYHHPIFDVESSIAQTKIDKLNMQDEIHFTGSYYRYGFHEDALLSSVNLCSAILGEPVL